MVDPHDPLRRWRELRARPPKTLVIPDEPIEAVEPTPPPSAPADDDGGEGGNEEVALPFHCARCDKRWGGLSTTHCAVCHRTFSAPTPFVAHRKEGICRHPASIGQVEYQRSGYRVWGTSGGREAGVFSKGTAA